MTLDGLTVLAAWIGALTGVGSLLYQYVVHRRTGAVLHVTGDMATSPNDPHIVTSVTVTVRNRGRHYAIVEEVLLLDHRPAGRIGRWLGVGGRRGSGPPPSQLVLSGEPWTHQIEGLSSKWFSTNMASVRNELGDASAVFPLVRTASGDAYRGRKIKLEV